MGTEVPQSFKVSMWLFPLKVSTSIARGIDLNLAYQNILSNECKKYVKVVIKHLIYKYTNAVKSETKTHNLYFKH